MIVEFNKIYNPNSRFCPHFKDKRVEYIDNRRAKTSCTICDYILRFELPIKSQSGQRYEIDKIIVNSVNPVLIILYPICRVFMRGIELNPKILPKNIELTTINEHIRSRMVLL